jgi:adenosine deaminase
MRELLQRLPKAELHVHLRGAAPVETLLSLIARHGVDTVLAELSPLERDWYLAQPHLAAFVARRGAAGHSGHHTLFGYTGFEGFLATYSFVGRFVRTIDDFALLVEQTLASLAAQRIVYAEIMVSIPEYLRNGLRLPEMAEVLGAAAAEGPLAVGWIVDLVRDQGPEPGAKLVRELAGLGCPAIIGVTIGGGEHVVPARSFVEVFRLARECGFRLTAHAGEAAGPESVWSALRDLGVQRVGHGVRAAEDARLLELLSRQGTPFEICLTSNLRTGVVRDLESHPVRTFLERGIPVSLSTDDPTFFATNLVEEHLLLRELGVNEADLLEVLRNGFRHSFLPPAKRRELLAGFEHELEQARASGTPPRGGRSGGN